MFSSRDAGRRRYDHAVLPTVSETLAKGGEDVLRRERFAHAGRAGVRLAGKGELVALLRAVR